MTDSIALTASLTVLAYLWGTFPSAVIVCRVLGIPDPRQRGSGNPGTTNVLRIGNRQAAVLTLIGDTSKGIVALLPCVILDMSHLSYSFCAVAAVLGHMLPVFSSFRGGKGVATTFGVSLMLFWPLALLQLILWSTVVLSHKIASLASITTALISPLFIWLTAPHYLLTFWLLAALLVFSHRHNIRNLLTGKEPRL
jgi:glycerol-3-phosphate acyltransferase PlsY